MRSSGRPRLAGVLVAALIGGLAAVPGTAVAAQDPNWASLNPTKWVTTDSRAPHQEITTGDARVGSWRDAKNRYHTSKSYFTFDITRFKGTQLFSASIRTPEKAANDCTKPRATELWVVEPKDKITWAKQPREVMKIAGPNPTDGCVTPWLTWNVVDAVKDALAKGRTSITVVVRISRNFQGNVAHGRTHEGTAVLNTEFNSSPNTPTGLTLEHLKCGGETLILANSRPQVSAAISDPDGVHGVDGRLAFWPANAPEQRVEVSYAGTGRVTGLFPEGMVKDSGTYAFAARAEDGHANSEWSAPCLFTADLTAPAKEPTVSSTVYKENGGPPGDGGEGIPGDFTFNADGDQDVVAFEYSGLGISGGRVNADRPGGTATVSVTPTTDGPVHIQVSGIDRAGLRSPARTYRYWVRTTAPFVQLPLFEIGAPADIVFTANQDGAKTFVYKIDDGAEQTLPVGADRKGRVTLTFPVPGQDRHDLEVWTVNGADFRSGNTERAFHVDQLQPWVDVDPWSGVVGQKRVITVTPNRDGVVSYVYKIGDDPEVTLPAAADGSLTFEHTPAAPGFFDVRVASANAAGVRSGWGETTIEAEAPAPTVTSAEYPGSESGGPGVTGTFTFSSPRLPVVSYRYSFNGGAEQTVAAGADGTASIQWRPMKPGFLYLHVRGVTEHGVVTEQGSHTFWVKAMPPAVVSPQFPDGGPPTAKPGQPVEFTVTPAVPGSNEVLWQIGFGQAQAVPVGADGKATFTYTPAGSFELSAWSRTPEGVESGKVTRTYHVPS